MEVSTTGFQTVKLGNFKDTVEKVFPDLWMEDSWMLTNCGTAAHQHQHQEFRGSRAKNNKTSMRNTMVIT